MPRKKIKAKKRRSATPDWKIETLRTGKRLPKTAPESDRFEEFMNFYSWEHRKPVWEEHREAILVGWIEEHPGTRPYAWWEYDAPRRKSTGAHYDNKLCEPRRQVGGTGTPKSDVLAIVPRYPWGVPCDWVNQWEVDYYNGQAKDVHGKPIWTNHKPGDFEAEALDENDPPIFESQATYLDRHGLLTDSERKRLKPEDFEPESVLEILN